MRALARRVGVAEPAELETWGVVGLLHDFDYERWPTEADHVFRGMEILRERGWPEVIVKAVGAHAFYTGVPRETPMEKAIVAADELTGFVGACAVAGGGGRFGPGVFHLDDDVVGGRLVGFGRFARFGVNGPTFGFGFGFAGGRQLVERGEVDRVVLFLLEHHVGLERLHDLGLQLEHGQLQQLDGLLQLRGHR